MCEKALSIDPHLSEARLVRARLAWTPKAGFNHEMAMREAGAALAGQPNLGQGWTTMGLIAFHIGLTEEARMLCVRSLAIDPGDFFALTHIAYTHYLEGDWRRAVAAAAEVWRRAPTSWAGYQLALSQLHLGQFAEAQQLADRVMRQFVGDVLLHPINALIAAHHGDPARVRHHIEMTVRHEKGFGHYHHAQYDVGCSLADRRCRRSARLARTGGAERVSVPGSIRAGPVARFVTSAPALCRSADAASRGIRPARGGVSRGHARHRTALLGRTFVVQSMIPAGVAQLVRARGSYPRRPGFKSLHRHHLLLR
jgi:hypothetical protein